MTGKSEPELLEGFEERVKDKGIVVREWVDQREILMHCGWNSVLESDNGYYIKSNIAK